MTREDVKILLDGLVKTCKLHSYCIEESHWAFNTGNRESKYKLSIVPCSPAQPSLHSFNSEFELFEYIEALIGDTHV
jgi:hypothetical protein